MTQIAISDEVATSLASAASIRGCTQEELASMLIEEGLRAEQEFELTPEQQTHLLESYKQLQRGEVIDGEIVMKKLDDLITKLESR